MDVEIYYFKYFNRWWKKKYKSLLFFFYEIIFKKSNLFCLLMIFDKINLYFIRFWKYFRTYLLLFSFLSLFSFNDRIFKLEFYAIWYNLLLDKRNFAYFISRFFSIERQIQRAWDWEFTVFGSIHQSGLRPVRLGSNEFLISMIFILSRKIFQPNLEFGSLQRLLILKSNFQHSHSHFYRSRSGILKTWILLREYENFKENLFFNLTGKNSSYFL